MIIIIPAFVVGVVGLFLMIGLGSEIAECIPTCCRVLSYAIPIIALIFLLMAVFPYIFWVCIAYFKEKNGVLSIIGYVISIVLSVFFMIYYGYLVADDPANYLKSYISEFAIFPTEVRQVVQEVWMIGIEKVYMLMHGLI